MSFTRLKRDLKLLSIIHLHSGNHIGDSDPHRLTFGNGRILQDLLYNAASWSAHAASVVFNGNLKEFPVSHTRDPDHPPAVSAFKSMEYGVLHERLQHKLPAWPVIIV